MRTALCMYGKIGGSRGKDGYGDPVDFGKCLLTIKEHIIDINNCDVFIHNWNPELKDTLIEMYQPKDYIIEPQIRFKTTKKYFKERRDEFIGQSRWYSNKQTLTLKRKYELKNKFNYDWVMVCRFDLLFFTDYDFSKLDSSFLYASNFNNWKPPNKENDTIKKRRLLDMWFIGPTRLMDVISKLYDNFYQYPATDPHRAIWEHLEAYIGDPLKITRFKFYRWFDYELYRIKYGSRL